MPCAVMWTANGLTACCSLWDWMSFGSATAHVLACFSLIHTALVRDAARFKQSVMMLAMVRAWVVSDTLASGAPMREMVRF